MSKSNEYTKGELTVVWKPDVCIHSANCVKGLPSVFKPNDKPWIQLDASTTEEIKAQVDKCPSGALSYYTKDSEDQGASSEKEIDACKMDLIENGPIIVNGHIEIQDKDGNKETRTGKTVLCRCGASSKKPFCDGAHKKIGFKS